MDSGRPFRRAGPAMIARAAGAAMLPLRPRGILRNANTLFESGQFAQAAPILENLANMARQQGMPRAPFLTIRAARANVLAGNVPQGVQLFRTAFEILAAGGAVALLFPAARRFINDLNTTGHTKEAQEAQAFVSTFPGWSNAAPAAGAAAHPPLPTNCPHCGASLRSDEVDWIDAQTAECTYCGSPVR